LPAPTESRHALICAPDSDMTAIDLAIDAFLTIGYAFGMVMTCAVE
jgi:hypothetical protein